MNSKNQDSPAVIEIREVEARDFSALTKLNPWELKKPNPRYSDWLIGSAPWPGIHQGAFYGPKAVGYYGVSAVMMKIGAEKIPCYHGDLFVHGNFRGPKYDIFRRLVNAMDQAITKRGHLIYGFPRLWLIKFYQEVMGASILKPIPRYELTLKPAGFFSKGLSSLFPKRIQGPNFKIARIASFDARFDRLWEKVSGNYPVIASRGGSYLNWRYAQEPGARYVFFAAQKNSEALGYIILRPAAGAPPRTGVILDLFDNHDPEITQALLSQAVHYFQASGARRIGLNFSNEYYESQLKAAGFSKLEREPIAGEVLMAKSFSAKIPPAIFQKPENWFINTADTLMA